MKCLIIVQNYPPEIGAVRYTFDLANALNESGNEISVITGFPNYPYGQKYPGFEKNKLTKKNENGIEVIRVPLLRASNTQLAKRILGFITFFINALPQLVKKRNVDIIIVSIPSFIVICLGILGKLFFRIPFIVVLRDFEPYDSLRIREISENKLVFFLTKQLSKIYYFADTIVTVFSGQINSIRKLGLRINNINVISHPLDSTRFKPEPDSEEPFMMKSKKGSITGIYVGTFGKCHGLPRLIDSLISAKISQLPIDFIFIGEGEDKNECEQLVGKSGDHHVNIYDAVCFKDVPGMLQCADFLIYSRKTGIYLEGVGSKFYEYLASGKPVMVCGQSSANEIVSKIQNGWCVDSCDIDIIYKCLQQILTDRLLFNEMGMRGRVYIEEYVKNNAFRDNWINLCDNLIKR